MLDIGGLGALDWAVLFVLLLLAATGLYYAYLLCRGYRCLPLKTTGCPGGKLHHLVYVDDDELLALAKIAEHTGLPCHGIRSYPPKRKKQKKQKKPKTPTVTINVETIGGPEHQVKVSPDATVANFVKEVEREIGKTGVFYRKAPQTYGPKEGLQGLHPSFDADGRAVVLNPERYELNLNLHTAPKDQVVPMPGVPYRRANEWRQTKLADLMDSQEDVWVMQSGPFPPADLDEGDLVVVDLETPRGAFVGRVIDATQAWEDWDDVVRGGRDVRAKRVALVEFTPEVTNLLAQRYGATYRDYNDYDYETDVWTTPNSFATPLAALKSTFVDGIDVIRGSTELQYSVPFHPGSMIGGARWENVIEGWPDWHRLCEVEEACDEDDLDINDSNRVVLSSVPRIYMRKV